MRETLIAAGYVREVKAKGSAPVWRRDNDIEGAFALKLTAAGAKAVAEERTPFAGEQGDGQGDATRATDDARLPGVAVAERGPQIALRAGSRVCSGQTAVRQAILIDNRAVGSARSSLANKLAMLSILRSASSRLSKWRTRCDAPLF